MNTKCEVPTSVMDTYSVAWYVHDGGAYQSGGRNIQCRARKNERNAPKPTVKVHYLLNYSIKCIKSISLSSKYAVLKISLSWNSFVARATFNESHLVALWRISAWLFVAHINGSGGSKEMQNARVKTLINESYCRSDFVSKIWEATRALCCWVDMDSWQVKQTDIDIWRANSHTADNFSTGFHVSCNSIGPGITCDIHSVHCVSIQDTGMFAIKWKRCYHRMWISE
jgi:hypothetical protein